MKKEHVLIFANPIAGKGKAKRIAAVLEEELKARGYGVKVFLSKMESTGTKLDGRIRAAIVVGGDGTLRGVAQWAIDSAFPTGEAMCASGELANLPYPLLIVPMGTANLMGKHLGVHWSDENIGEEVAEALEAGKVQYLDVARTNGGIFLLMAGVGFDAWVVHELDRIRSGPIDFMNYIMPAMKAIAEYQFPTLAVMVDGKQVFKKAPALALVGNIREYGTGFAILPQARPDDQLLDVCVMPCASPKDLIKLALSAAAGEHVQQEGVVYVKGRQVRIESTMPVPVQVDGEPAGQTPIDIDLLPCRIPFIVPL
ncbi:MAG TPA: diacylglycerol kinase family protein [Tepidisphaeraceae bacterium]|nr:diacylglycerol kinase family protein [Tepidisphaeraceae bacterium]